MFFGSLFLSNSLQEVFGRNSRMVLYGDMNPVFGGGAIQGECYINQMQLLVGDWHFQNAMTSNLPALVLKPCNETLSLKQLAS